MEGSYEYVNKPSVSIKFWEILEWLSDWWLLKKESTPWRYWEIKHYIPFTFR
jgi:hypothetical protein